jgi:hypothetical protein
MYSGEGGSITDTPQLLFWKEAQKPALSRKFNDQTYAYYRPTLSRYQAPSYSRAFSARMDQDH